MNSVTQHTDTYQEEPEEVADTNESNTLRRLQMMRSRMMSELPEDTTVSNAAANRDSSAGITVNKSVNSLPAQTNTAVSSTVNRPTADRTEKIETFSIMTEEAPLKPSNSTNVVKTETLRTDTVRTDTARTDSVRVARKPEPAGSSYWNNDITANSLRENAQKMPSVSGISVGSNTGMEHSPWNQTLPNQTLQNQTSQKDAVDAVPSEQKQAAGRLSSRERAILVSPLLEVETEGDSRIVVGKESLYRIRLRNRGGAAAEQVVLTVDIPTWIEILPPDVSTGTTSMLQTAVNAKGESKESRDFIWKISRLDPTAEEQLVLHLVPQERKTVDLRIRYDFYKTSAVAKIEVQQPVVEMTLQGPDEVLWGTKVGYKLVVKNTGNGEAEKLNLELLQTGSDMKSCALPVLKAGEEQTIDVDVWTGKQDHIDINILATGSYDVTSQVSKRVKVLRPNVSVKIDGPEMQFVDNPAEFHIVVKNEGTAPANNLDLSAVIPLGAKYLTNDTGGKFSQQNVVSWNIPSIAAGGEFAATIVCEPKREGLCKLEISVSDSSGLIAGTSGSVSAEAIADLKMDVENPQGPVEVGQEATYTINVSNRGTKPAEDVEVFAAFAAGLEPFAVEGANGTMNNGQVVFDKIPSVSAGQTITLKIKVRAEESGKHRMRAEVNCPGVNAHLLFEQATYYYKKHKNRGGKENEETNYSADTSPEMLNAVRKETEPKPLRAALPDAVLPSIAAQNPILPAVPQPTSPQPTATAKQQQLEDPFLR
ncbi:hypothetical protein FACS189427_00500 [Planctomycetales bacterium]|nr:hypothetical protein FACS189427_00500 [Planctomycetales bacterium]